MSEASWSADRRCHRAENVREISLTVGTGPYLLAGATAGGLTFAEAFGRTATVRYLCVEGRDWETGVGTYNHYSNSLSRDRIIYSSRGEPRIGHPLRCGEPINWGCGIRCIFTRGPRWRTTLGEVAALEEEVSGLEKRITQELKDLDELRARLEPLYRTSEE